MEILDKKSNRMSRAKRVSERSEFPDLQRIRECRKKSVNI